MIEQLELKNFQSHQGTSLKFTPGVNVILGRSDSGKSAIIRALRWLVYGKPRGDSFRSWWGGDTAVTIKLPTGTITRMKTSSVNGYTLDTPEFQGARGGSGKLPTPGNSMVFRAIGTDPIMEIDQAINMGELNLQQQADSPYLISSTPGEVAAHFSKIARLEKIQQGLKFVQSKIRQFTSQVEAKETQLTALRNQFREYGWVDESTSFVEGLKNKVTARDSGAEKIAQLETLMQAISQTQKQIQELFTKFPGEKEIQELVSQIEKRDQKQKEKHQLQLLLSNMRSQKILAKRCREFLQVAPGEFLFTDIQTKEHHADTLYDLITAIKSQQEKSTQYQNELNAAETLLGEIDICPLCGNSNTSTYHDH